MNKGIIVADFRNNLVVLHEIPNKDGEPDYEELPLHPFFKNYKSFVLGQRVDFQYAHECTLHYPEYCACYTKKLFALIVPPKKKSLLDRIKKFFKKK